MGCEGEPARRAQGAEAGGLLSLQASQGYKVRSVFKTSGGEGDSSAGDSLVL